MSDAAEVLSQNDGGVRIITLNRPDRLNALVSSIMSQLVDATADAARDPSVGCVVVTGAGRGFCSGGDIKGERDPVVVDEQRGRGRVGRGFNRLRGFMETSRLLHEMGKPTIAMINGPVAGAGIGIAGSCDLRFAAESATFLSAFDRIGASGDFRRHLVLDQDPRRRRSSGDVLPRRKAGCADRVGQGHLHQGLFRRDPARGDRQGRSPHGRRPAHVVAIHEGQSQLGRGRGVRAGRWTTKRSIWASAPARRL